LEQSKRYIEEDEIDLRELWQTIVKRKKLIFLVTAVITIVAIVWALTRTPMYEVRALVEIGSYKMYNNNNNNNNNNKAILDNASQLAKKLNILFIDMNKNTKDKLASIESIKVPKGSKNFIEIKSLATSNDLASKEIQKIVEYIQTKHLETLTILQKERDNKYKTITKQIENNIKNVDNFNKNNLSAIDMIELLRIKEKIDTMTLEQNNIKNLLAPHNYKNTQVIGEIITNDYPVKPKKKLIVVVAFVTGFILSIFLVFFLEFIGKNEDKEEVK